MEIHTQIARELQRGTLYIPVDRYLSACT